MKEQSLTVFTESVLIPTYGNRNSSINRGFFQFSQICDPLANEIHKAYIIRGKKVIFGTWQSIFDEKLLEIPESEIGDFGFKSFGGNEDIAGLEVAVKDRVPKVVQVSNTLCNA